MSNRNFSRAVVREIPSVDVTSSTFSAKEFFKEYILNRHPVKLIGFAKNTPAVQNWTLVNLLRKYGDEEVKLRTTSSDNILGKFKDVKNEGTYLHNCEVLFLRHPKLKEDLEIEKLNALVFNRIANDHPSLGSLPLQLFCRYGGTGTAFHCANAFNFFY